MEDEVWELLDLPDDEPDNDVFGYLLSGLDNAANALEPLNAIARGYVEAVGELAVEWKESVVVSPDHEVFLREANSLFENPWFRHAAEVRLAGEVVDRTSGALNRWRELQPIVTSSPLPDAAMEYVKELTQTYLYGFDVACIAFCGAAVEQVLKDVLVQVGEYTVPQLRRERPTGLTLVLKAKSRKILLDTVEAADSIMLHRNKVMHARAWETRTIRPIALGCIERFGKVVNEIERRRPERHPSPPR